MNALLKLSHAQPLPEVALIVGDEGLLIRRCVNALRQASVGDLAEFNAERFTASASTEANSIIAAAQTLPMMSDRRFVLIEEVNKLKSAEQAALAKYFSAPSPTTCFIAVAAKLDGRSALVKAAKKQNAYYTANLLKRHELREFLRNEAKEKGHAVDDGTLMHVVDACGEELAACLDALERLSLYVGPGQRIDQKAVSACVSQLGVDSIWKLVDAIGAKNPKKALTAAESLLAAREPPTRLLAMVTRQLSQIAKMRSALAAGERGADAARSAGIPPFKAADMTAAAKNFDRKNLQQAFSMIEKADLDLKGSKNQPENVISQLIMRLAT